jgi:hypothetical protein
MAGARLNVPWFESPFFERDLERSDLDDETRERVRSFAERGYLVLDLEPERFERLADEIVAGLAGEHQEVGNRVQDAWKFIPAVRELATDPNVIAALSALYGRRPVPFQTLNFERGTEQETHSDLVHFNSFPPRYMAGVWVALEDVRPESGPLHYYPGSHRLPVYEPHDISLKGSSSSNRDEQYRSYEAFVRELLEQSGLPRERVALKRGQALIWASNLMHGGDPISDPQSTRRSQVTHYYFEGCRYYTPLYSDPPLGRYHWRRVIDVGTGKEQPHVYQGERARIPLSTRARSLVENGLRGSTSGRAAIRRIRRLMGRTT